MVAHRELERAMASAMWVLYCLVTGTAAAVGERLGGGSFKMDHHHCVHEEKARQFEESIDLNSVVVPQLVVPFESPGQRELDAYLEVVGGRNDLRSLTKSRSLASTGTFASFQPIRIVFDLSKLTSDPGYMCTEENQDVEVDGAAYTCTNGDVLTPDKKDFIVSVLLKAIEDYFEDVLSVQRVVGNLVVKGIGCSSGDNWACCSNSILSTYKTQGVADADYLLHVTARPTTGATIAWALPCNLDQYGRPISGQANFGPGRLDPFTAAARTEQVGTALHEMTHALVFSKSRFYDFRQPLNGDKWGYSNVVSQSQGSGGTWVSKIVTPSVARQVKQHFNCFDWVNAGLELENGDSGSADFSSHWEKRLMMNEYMTATSSYDPIYSAMTLALFEDSGWYQVSYKNAQILPWGYMEGCGLAQGRCSTWSSRYICSDGAQTGCTADYTSKGYCNVASYQSSIPAGFQYFQDPSFGGRDTYADYCPFYRAYSNGDCRGIGRVPTNANTANYMEDIGPNSRCFQSSLSKSSSDAAALRSTCYSVVKCSSEGLTLIVGDERVLCPLKGGKVKVNGYRGKLVCPDAANLCRLLQPKCSGNGVWLESGSCQCNPGYVGSDCSGVACPVSQANNKECGGSVQGKCDYTTGKCSCTAAYTGLTCSGLVCPAQSGGKNTSECSGHGFCNRAFGHCECKNGFSGKACECVPGCSSTTCGPFGNCDCTTGGCTCDRGYSGVNCSKTSEPLTTELWEDVEPINDTVADKEYRFYKIYLQSSTYDVTVSVQYANNVGVDVDLYGSFNEPFPTSLSAKYTLFVSDFSIGNRDEINLCGSLGAFPRSLNDSFRFCARPSSAYMLETPGYFYVSVFGYVGGEFSISVMTDKCKNVTCFDHGSCGLNYPGVCTCDRYWTGDDCSIPKCGPDCHDLGTCTPQTAYKLLTGTSTSGSSSTTGTTFVPVRNGTLQQIPECYGNGVCHVDEVIDTPRCVCDPAFSYVNPTPDQAMCKELLPSISFVQEIAPPYSSTVSGDGQALDVNAWALYSLEVLDDWEMVATVLTIRSENSDTMLFVSRGKLPSVLLVNSNQITFSASAASASSIVDFMDTEGWMFGSATRKIVLSRAAGTLSTDVYYIGVFNSAYATASLSYTLSVEPMGDCASLGNSVVCANGGVCSFRSIQICSCLDGFFGEFCDYSTKSAVLSPPPSKVLDTSSGASSNDSTIRDATSYVAYESPVVEVLGAGEWEYYAFDVGDPDVQAVQFRLIIDSDPTTTLPVLFVRSPHDDGFPSLTTQSFVDFDSVSRQRSTQSVSLVVDGLCSADSSPTGCYKVAVYNRDYSKRQVQYRVQVELFRIAAAMFLSSICAPDKINSNCGAHGRCSTNHNTTEEEDPAGSPKCQCDQAWVGLRCESPRLLQAPHLWSASTNVSDLCVACNATFSLPDGEVRIFRLPAYSLAGDSIVRVRVRALDASTSLWALAPRVFVSETLPRSLYDFTFISDWNTSSVTGECVVELDRASATGSLWVVVYSELLDKTRVDHGLAKRRSLLHTQHSLRLLGNAPTKFTLSAEVSGAHTAATSQIRLHKSSSTRVVFNWLFRTPGGVVVVVVVLLVLCVGGFSAWWRRRQRTVPGEPSTDTATSTTASDIELGQPTKP